MKQKALRVSAWAASGITTGKKPEYYCPCLNNAQVSVHESFKVNAWHIPKHKHHLSCYFLTCHTSFLSHRQLKPTVFCTMKKEFHPFCFPGLFCYIEAPTNIAFRALWLFLTLRLTSCSWTAKWSYSVVTSQSTNSA